VKALSLWQPWASAIALGLKRIETRHWRTPYRGPLAIHAAKRWTADEREFHAVEHEGGRMPAVLPLGAVVAVCRLVDCRPTERLLPDLSDDEVAWGNYGRGRWGWILADVEPLAVPVPYRGLQRLFDIPDELLGRERGFVPDELMADLFNGGPC
jgi:hypothetical protein